MERRSLLVAVASVFGIASTVSAREQEACGKDLGYYFEYYRACDGWRWRLKAANGRTVASGEPYASKQGVQLGIQRIKDATRAPSRLLSDLTEDCLDK